MRRLGVVPTQAKGRCSSPASFRSSVATMKNAEIKDKLRRAARYLQGNDTRYFSDLGKYEAIQFLYRHADQFTE